MALRSPVASAQQEALLLPPCPPTIPTARAAPGIRGDTQKQPVRHAVASRRQLRLTLERALLPLACLPMSVWTFTSKAQPIKETDLQTVSLDSNTLYSAPGIPFTQNQRASRAHLPRGNVHRTLRGPQRATCSSGGAVGTGAHSNRTCQFLFLCPENIQKE